MGVLRNFIAGVGAAIGAAIPGGDPATPAPDDPAVLAAAGEIAPIPYPNPLFLTGADTSGDTVAHEPSDVPAAIADEVPAPLPAPAEAEAEAAIAEPGAAVLAAAAPSPPAGVAPGDVAAALPPDTPPPAGAEPVRTEPPADDHIGPVAGILDTPVTDLDTALLAPEPAAPDASSFARTPGLNAADAFAPGGAFDALFGADAMTLLRGPQAAVVPVPMENPLGYRDGADLILAALPPNQPALSADRPDAACLTRLAGLQVAALAMPVIHEGSCGVETPIEIASIGGSEGVRFSPAAVVDCGVTDALSSWLLDVVRPAARDLLRQDVIGIRVASGYACRGRNNDPAAELSEHAFGNAIDISAFQLADGSWLEVKPEAELERREAEFERTIRDAACGPFKTVLGPGVAMHDDHFHLDMAARRNGSVYCR